MKAIARARDYASSATAFIFDKAIAAFPALSRADRPPNALAFGGGGDFIQLGDNLVHSIVELTGLRAGQTVVDIGCGIGRNATALHRLFGDAIAYRGFDIVRFGVTWCRKHFESLDSGYRFDHADIRNTAYNPLGRLHAPDYRFPYPDSSADVAFATSVFTHVQPAGVERYIKESSRILRVGGQVYFTFFILDAESEMRVQKGEASFSFRHPIGACRVEDADEPDGVVAYPYSWVEAALAGAGFDQPRLLRGSWRDGRDSESAAFQDVVVALKPG